MSQVDVEEKISEESEAETEVLEEVFCSVFDGGRCYYNPPHPLFTSCVQPCLCRHEAASSHVNEHLRA